MSIALLALLGVELVVIAGLAAAVVERGRQLRCRPVVVRRLVRQEPRDRAGGIGRRHGCGQP